MRGLLFILFSLGLGTGFAQTRDAILWTGLGLKADLTKKIELKYETQTRFNKNFSSLNTYYNELSVDFNLPKKFTAGFSYRFSRENRDTHFENDNRFCFNLEHELEFGKTGFELKSRGRLQLNFDRLSATNTTIYPNQAQQFRLKLDLRYKNDVLKRFEPRIYYELFQAIDGSALAGRLSAYRVGGGFEIDLPNRQEISFKYIYECEQDLIPEVSHIYMVQYNYSFKSRIINKKKKKKKN